INAVSNERAQVVEKLYELGSVYSIESVVDVDRIPRAICLARSYRRIRSTVSGVSRNIRTRRQIDIVNDTVPRIALVVNRADDFVRGRESRIKRLGRAKNLDRSGRIDQNIRGTRPPHGC